jgi:hypothetical protein
MGWKVLESGNSNCGGTMPESPRGGVEKSLHVEIPAPQAFHVFRILKIVALIYRSYLVPQPR